jgi:hypothetical protein
MHWWQIPLFILVAAWALYLYSTPSAKVTADMAKFRNSLKALPGSAGQVVDVTNA